MSAAVGTLPGWRGSLARRIESPRAQAALIALILVNAVILGLETSEQVMAELRRIIADPSVEVLPHDWAGMPVSPVARLDSEMYRAIEKAQAAVFPAAITLPQMGTGATDSALIRSKGVQSYGVGVPATDQDAEGTHGNDERVSTEAMGQFVEFLYRAVTDVAAAH